MTTTTAAERRTRAKAPIAGAVLHLWDRATGDLDRARIAGTPTDRYVWAHLAALRAGAALLAAHHLPSRRSRPRSVWELLPEAEPDLEDWALFFSGTGRRRVRLEQGTGTVTTAEAEELTGQVEVFLEVVRESLSIPTLGSVGDLFTATSR